MSTCEHENFFGQIDVNRITADEGGPVTAFSVDLKVKCVDCGEDFIFFCPDQGDLPDRPAVSLDGTEIRLPIAPLGNPEAFRSAMGFRMRTYRPPLEA